MATQAQLAAVQQLYVGYLGRAADAAGQKFWADAIAAGTATIQSVATGFTLSAEYKAAYAGLSNDALVDKVYTNVLGRTSDAAGKAFWVNALATGAVTADTLVATIVTNLGALDQTTINNKVFVAQTYTNTVGTEYNATAGANVLVGVNSTSASVTAALGSINSGALAGQVPGLGLINAKVAAEAAVVAYGTANKAALDALATKLGVPTTGTFATELGLAVTAASAARTTASGEADTSVLVARAATASTNLNTANSALTSTEKAAANAYTAAIANEASAKAAGATVTEVAGVKAALNADTTATAKITAYNSGAGTIDFLYSAYVNGAAATRAAIDADFAGISTYAAFKTTAAKDAAYAGAIKATLAAKDVLDTDTAVSTVTAAGFDTAANTVNGVTLTVAAAETSVGSAAANTFVTSLATKLAADATLTAAQAADANVAAVKVINDALGALSKVSNDAGTAITTFNTNNATTAVIKDLDVTVTATSVKDVFYFADKATSVAVGDDYTISSFLAGDAIVLGAGYSFNSGALSTGNNNALEVFFVNSTSGVQVVVESTVAGTTNASTAATTGVITSVAGATDTTTVITLTGVTADQLSFNNGVVSFV